MTDPIIPQEKKPLSEEGQLKLKSFQYDFWKFFIGTFLIGLAGVISTAIFKSYELKISSRNSENAYLNAYITQYTNFDRADTVRKYDRIVEMFEVLSIATTDKDLEEKWDSVRLYFQHKIDVIKDSVARYKDSINRTQTDINIKQEKNDSLGKVINNLVNNLRSSTGDSVRLQQLRIERTQLLDSISTAQQKLNEFAAAKLDADKYANQRLASPPTVLPKTEGDYEVIYDADRFAAEGYYNEIVEGIVVHINDYDNNSSTVKLSVDWNGQQQQKLELKPGSSSPTLFFGDKKLSVTLSLKSFARRIALGKKVATYQIVVQKQKE